MRRNFFTVALALALLAASAVPAAPAMAAQSKPTPACVESCKKDFPGGDPITVAIRGWCYIIRCILL